jgi:uncharacterized Tic20 family protein
MDEQSSSSSTKIVAVRGPRRRLAATGLLLVAISGFVLTSLDKDWYKMEISNFTILNFSGDSYKNVDVSKGYSISEIVSTAEVPVYEEMGKELVNQRSVSGIFGQPKTILWYFTGLVLLTVGCSMASISLSLLGLISMVFSWRELVSLRNIIENPYFGGEFSIPAEGLLNFQLSLILSIVIAVSCTLQAGIILWQKRTKERKLAVANGEEITPTILEGISGLIAVSRNYRKDQVKSN